MKNDRSDIIENYIGSFYKADEYPCLFRQIKAWRKTKPLKGMKVLDASPLFRNTLTKYIPLLAGGADLTVGVSDLIPRDPHIMDILSTWEIPVENNSFSGGDYDLILDCAGIHAGKPVRFGYSELTRSGADRYSISKKPVFMTDDSMAKLLEDTLGTGDGFIRAMNHLGYTNFNNKSIVVFGCGKVGRGISIRLYKAGARVTAVDDLTVHHNVYPFSIEDYRNIEKVSRIVSNAWCVVTATGVKHALAKNYTAELFIDSPALLVNMGVENEFGPGVGPDRVLNRNAPLNFILDEPTHLRYIDATLALHNEGAAWILRNECPPGLFSPPCELDMAMIRQTREMGVIGQELDYLTELGILRDNI